MPQGEAQMTEAREDEVLLVLCTAPAEGEVAGELARGLVEAGLAACVNLVGPVRSVYRWQGAVQDEPELQLLIKTRRGCYRALERWLGQHHPYQVPEILALPIVAGARSYLEWLAAQTQPADG